MKNVLRKINIIMAFAVICGVVLFGAFRFIAIAQVSKTVSAFAYIVNDKNVAISNGEYEVRFAIYNKDRSSVDKYPSDTDAASRVWSETQKVQIYNGLLSAQLGTTVAFPENLNFFGGDYYLGIRIGDDSEMVPRKKIGAVPQAISAINLQGATLGSGEGNIIQLGKGGKIDNKFLSTGTGSRQLVLGNDSRLHKKNADTGTNTKTFTIGLGASVSENFDLAVSGDSQKPTLRFDGSLGKWMFSNDGSTFQAIAGMEVANIARGGTGIDSYVAGDLLYYDSGETLSKLPIGLNGQVLAISGGKITWASSAPLSPHDLLSVGHSDVVPATAENGDILIAAGSPVRWTRLPGGNNGQVLTMSNGVPVWNAASNSVIHSFLSPTHDDVTPGSPVRGAVITGQGASPTWSVLAPSAANQFLKFNGTDAAWSLLTKSDVELSNVENTALSTWNGSANLTTLGTIASGTWNGSIIDSAYLDASLLQTGQNISLLANDAGYITASSVSTLTNKIWNGSVITPQYGGTGLSTYTTGDLLYSSNASTLSRLAIGVNGQILGISSGQLTWLSTAPSTPHQLLSAQHPDTTAANVQRGDLITGQGASSTWSRLALGSNGAVLRSNGTDITWSTLTKSDIGLSNVENTALSTWNGSTNLTTLGTIASGTWNGAVVTPQYGGTGVNASAAANGRLLIGNGSGFALGNITSGAGIQVTNGIGTINITNTGVTSLSGTVNQINVSASNGDVVISLPQTISTTSDVVFASLTLSSPLTISNGGTGLSAFTAGDMLYYNSGETLSKLAVGTNGQILTVSGGAPQWSNTGAATPHALLSSTHSDTTAANVQRGDLITGQGASSTWSRLALGSNGAVLRSNGTDITWSTLTKSDIGLSNVENTALSTWNGSTNLTTLGTIASGTWNGNAIALNKGGLGGDISASNGLIKVSGGLTTSVADNSSNWNTGYSHSQITGNPHGTTKADIGLSNAENTAISTWSGSLNLTTVGLIANGTWNGNIIGVQYGGTGTNNGSITGTGALTFASGGTNTNINLNPNGSGIVAVNGSFGVKAGSYNTIFKGSNSQAADITYTFPSATGSSGQVLKIDASNNLYWGTVSGGSGGIGTVTSVGAGNGLTGGPITESGTLAINLLSAESTSATTASYSGLEFIGASSQLALLQGCGNNEVLAWNSTNKQWGCSTVSGVGGITGNGVNGYVTYWTGVNTLASEQYLNVSRGGTGLNASAAANGTLLIGNNAGFSLATLTQGAGMTITNAAGSITVANAGVTGLAGTTNQVSVSAATGSVTLSLPQNIHSAASPTFAGLTLNGNLALGANTFTTSNNTVVSNLNADLLDGQHASAFQAEIIAGTVGQYWRGDKTWQTLDAAAVSLGNVENTALSAWVGSANLATLGTISSGVWNGSIIGSQYGGTGLNTSASTGIPTISSGNWAIAAQLGEELGGTGIDASAAGNGKLLIGNGAGFTLANLTQSAGITITNAAGSISIANSGVTSLSGTENQVTVSASSGDIVISLPQTISTTSDVSFNTLTLSNALNVSSGGTGIATYTTGDMIYASALNTLGKLAIGGNGTVLTVVDGVPTWSNTSLHGAVTLAGENYLSLSSQEITANPINLGNTNVTGTLTADKGGTGLVSYVTGDILYASGATTLGALPDVAIGNVLISGGIGSAPSWGKVGLTTHVSGTLGVGNGGTGTNAMPTGGQLLIGNGTDYTLATLTQGAGIGIANAAGSITISNTGVTSLAGTANQVSVSAATGSVTLSLPQDIATSSSPEFTGLKLTGLTQGSVPFIGATGLVSQDNANLFWDASEKRLGIGTASPTSVAELYSTTADAMLTITAASGSYSPLIQFRGGVTPSALFTMGVDASDSNKFKIFPGNSITGTNTFSIDSAGITSISSLEMGAQNFAADSGSISWIDMPVTSSATNGTIERYTAKLDGNSMLTIYGTSDGAGGVANLGVGINTTTPSGVLDVHGLGTTTGVTFQTADSTGAAKFTILDNGNVGIGTASPSSLLHMYGSGDSTGLKLTLQNPTAGRDQLLYYQGQLGNSWVSGIDEDSGSGYGSFKIARNDRLNGTNEYLTINGQTGFVGIGTTSPGANLDILNSLASNGLALKGTTTLQQATGNEVAYQLNYTTNKATSGNDTGLQINMTDTASPGTSYLIDAQVGGSSRFNVNSIGDVKMSTIGGINNATTFYLYGRTTSTGESIIAGQQNHAETSGSNSIFSILPTYNQTSGTAANTDLLINRTQTAIGSGAQYLIDAQVGGSSKFSVTNTGNLAFSGSMTGGTYNGNTISTGTGTLNLSSYTLALSGNSSINQDLLTTSNPTFATINTGQGAYELYAMNQNVLTTSSPTFAGVTLAYDETHTGELTVDSSGNLNIGTTTGYTIFNKAATQNYLQIFDSAGLGYLQLTHNGTNALISTNVGSVELGTSGDLELASGVNIVGDGDYKIKGDASSRTITIGDTAKANDDIVAIDASNWSVSTSGMINGSFDGVGTKVVGANVTDGAFTATAFNGLTAIDSSTGRYYYRYGGVWRYAAQAGGFQIPNYEVAPSEQLSQRALAEGANALAFEKTSHPEYLTKQMVEGEFLIPYVDEFLPDGAAHGLYARFDDVKGKMFANEISEILGLKVKSDEQITNVEQLKTVMNNQFAMAAGQMTILTAQVSGIEAQQKNQDARIATIESTVVALQQQVDDLRANIATPIDVAQLELNTQDIALIKLMFGIGTTENPADVKLLGKLKATIVEGNKLVINVNDENAKTIGQSKIVKISKDENSDGLDDENGSDGKTVFISTTSVNQNSKIFITPKVATDQTLAVVETKFGEGFTVSLKNVLTNESEDISFDWMMVEEGL